LDETELELGRKAKYETMMEMVATITSEATQRAMNMYEVELPSPDVLADKDMGVMESVSMKAGEAGVSERVKVVKGV